MNRFQQAADLNNKGVKSLLEGDHESAIDSMAQSMQLLKEEFSSGERPLHVENEFSSANLHRAQTVEIPRMESSDTIVFNQAILIPSTTADGSGAPTDYDLNIYISSVIFNLAITHHFQASGHAVSGIKAEKLYTMVSKLLDDHYLDAHTALVVKLACINNLSQLRYSKGDYKNAREGLNQVSLFMRQSSNQELFEEPEIQGLLMNVLLLKEPVVARAA